MAKLKSGLYIHREKDILNGNFLRLVPFDDGLQALEDLTQAVSDRGAGGRVDGADVNAAQLARGVEFNDAVAGMFGATINAQDAHARSLAPRGMHQDVMDGSCPYSTCVHLKPAVNY